MNLIQYITQADPEEEIVSRKRSPASNMNNWKKEYEKVKNIKDDKVTDENKHQYMSCLAGKGGKVEATLGWTTGLLKEGYDLARKIPNKAMRQQYNGVGNIIKDSGKDIANNWKGIDYGLSNKGKCINLLEKKLP